ncbi:WcaG Nucleoside-diphosphate-sugar epimerases [Candidatus Nanopelagicaceae bacterium]|jgi:nucleoside-diphosphate-sugar epimerase
MSGIHVVVGAGVVGSTLAELLANDGQDVIVVTRSGSGPIHKNIKKVAADVADLSKLLEIAPSAAAIYNCVNPPYHRWAKEWPPIAASFLSYAEKTGAVLVTCSNLYGYGPVNVPMTEDLPLNAQGVNGKVKARMWLDAKALNDVGRIKATEVRGSDYVCAGEQSRVGTRVMPKILAGKAAQVLGDIDVKHTWTYPLDVARLMQIIATDSKAWGKAWHVPSNDAKTQKELVSELAAVAGVKDPKLSSVPRVMWNLLGLFNPLLKALKETAYQFQCPYILDDSAARKTFGMQPTEWKQILNDVVAETRGSMKK